MSEALRIASDNTEAEAAIGNLLKAIEGMQEQVTAMTELLIQIEHRVSDLEKKAKPKLISLRS